ncbi:hypothetical protein TNCV_169631 [Trichonephila clavipes]|nr:hypothetical protein TNCV_169631 [Trichonephila clavipes]
MFEKVYVLLNCPTVSLEEFAAKSDNVYTALIMANKDILEFVQSSKNIIDADSDDENKMNNAALVPTSFLNEDHENYAQIYPCTFRWVNE